jgi:hypothetical protein
MAAHQSAVLRRDAAGQETLLVLLLRSYLADNLYDQVGWAGGDCGRVQGLAQAGAVRDGLALAPPPRSRPRRRGPGCGSLPPPALTATRPAP